LTLLAGLRLDAIACIYTHLRPRSSWPDYGQERPHDIIGLSGRRPPISLRRRWTFCSCPPSSFVASTLAFLSMGMELRHLS
jgi:hypothetical protein